jgi:hypothetical protein
MKFANATKPDRKSGVGQWRDLQFIFWGTRLKVAQSTSLGDGCPTFAPAYPDFLLRSVRKNRVCGFLLRKAACSSTTPPDSTGNPGYVGRKGRAKPTIVFRAPNWEPRLSVLANGRDVEIRLQGISPCPLHVGRPLFVEISGLPGFPAVHAYPMQCGVTSQKHSRIRFLI